jgi:hypothetical protein
MRQTEATAIKGHTVQRDLTDYRGVAARWRILTYLAAVSPILILLGMARVYPDINTINSPDWKPLISAADESWASGDRGRARHLYLKAERAAMWRQDWRGLVTTACRLNRLDGVNSPYSKAISILIQASTAAEFERSRRGMTTIAQSLSLLGKEEAAGALLARVQPGWANDTVGVDDLALLEGCSLAKTPPQARH